MPIVSTPAFFTKRLENAVKARALTWKALSEIADIRTSTLSDYYQGKATPSPTQLEKIAAALDFPVNYFLREGPIGASLVGPRLFRAAAGKTAKAANEAEARLSWLAECFTFAEGHLNLPKFDFLKAYAEIGDPFELDRRDLEAIAQAVREKLGFAKEPVVNLLRRLEQNGIAIIRYRGLLEGKVKIDALSNHCETGRPLCAIFSTESSSLPRDNFTIAHELGHIVLHSRVNEKRYDSPADSKTLEDQANQFASAFLLPKQPFLDELYAPTLKAFEFMKRKWRVSIAAMVRRCFDVGFIDRDKYTSLNVMISQRRWRKKEPLDDCFQIEEPKLLEKVIEALETEEGISAPDLSDALSLNPRDLASISGLPVSRFVRRNTSDNMLDFPGLDR